MGYKAKDLTVYKNNINIIDKISFDFPSGSYVSIIGPNGAGKTTLLKTLAGLLNYKGSLSINNQNVKELFKNSNDFNCAYVPQIIVIPEGMSLIEYIFLGRNSFTNWFLSEKFENLIFSVDYKSKWTDALLLIGIDPSKLSSYAGSS